MQNNFCLPIQKKNKLDILSMIQNNQDYAYFEVWLDYIENLDDVFITELVRLHEAKLIFLFRRKNLEPVVTDWEKRKNILSLLNNKNVLVDLDVINQLEELEYVRTRNLKILKITSYHNYDQTPGDSDLQKIIQKMTEFAPAIVKISTMCNNDNDALRLMNLLQLLKMQKLKFVVVGMGEYGKITRVYGLVQGNEINFAPKTLDDRSAPGQIVKQDLENIMAMLKK